MQPRLSPFFVAKNAVPGKALEFTVSGTGSMPREDQGAGGPQTAAPGNGQPGGGIGEPLERIILRLPSRAGESSAWIDAAQTDILRSHRLWQR